MQLQAILSTHPKAHGDAWQCAGTRKAAFDRSTFEKGGMGWSKSQDGEMPGTMEVARRLGCGPIVWRFQNGVSEEPIAPRVDGRTSKKRGLGTIAQASRMLVTARVQRTGINLPQMLWMLREPVISK